MKMTKPKRFTPSSKYVKYRDNTWIQCRKRIYLYWFKFLRHAEESSDHTVQWDKYSDWGGKGAVMSMKFDDWWNEHWKDCFGIDKETNTCKYPVNGNPKADGTRYALLVHENSHRGSNWDIAIHIQKEEMRKRGSVAAFTIKRSGFTMDENNNPIPINPFDLEGLKTKTRLTRQSAREWGEKRVRAKDEASRTGYSTSLQHTKERLRIEDDETYENREEKRKIQSQVGRFKKQAMKHLESACRGEF